MAVADAATRPPGMFALWLNTSKLGDDDSIELSTVDIKKSKTGSNKEIDRHVRRRPFAGLVKRFANFRNSSSANGFNSTKKSNGNHVLFKQNKPGQKNNPYPQSSYPLKQQNSYASGRPSTNTAPSHHNGSFTSYEDAISGANVPLRSNRSAALTFATNPETVHSEGASQAGTSNTVGGAVSSLEGGGQGANSTFSSRQQSQESLTTTLTTIQSTTPSGMLSNNPPQINTSLFAPVQYNQPYANSPPASAIPGHLQPGNSHPHTYQAATANNILTDNASILTLASSSKRRRRHSLDTDASVRALAPSSLFGNSRESLPLSVLSASATIPDGEAAGRPSVIFSSTSRPSVGGLASTERASIYSASASLTGVPPPRESTTRDGPPRDSAGRDGANSERNSYYAGKGGALDAASVRSGRSGLTGHGSVTIGAGGAAAAPAAHARENSISGSFTGMPFGSSPLASPKEAPPSLLRRRSRMSEESRPNSAEAEPDAEKID